MFNFLIKICMVFVIFHPGKLTAMMVAYDEDMNEENGKSYHKNFLISEVDYEQMDKADGVMTLCFKTPEAGGIFDHTALIFEIVEKETNKIALNMIHYTGADGNCGHG